MTVYSEALYIELQPVLSAENICPANPSALVTIMSYIIQTRGKCATSPLFLSDHSILEATGCFGILEHFDTPLISVLSWPILKEFEVVEFMHGWLCLVYEYTPFTHIVTMIFLLLVRYKANMSPCPLMREGHQSILFIKFLLFV